MLPMNPSSLYFIVDLEPECSDQSSPLTPPTPSSPGAKGTEPPPQTPQFLFLSSRTDSLYRCTSFWSPSSRSVFKRSALLSLPGPENLRGKPLPHCLRAKAPTLAPLRHGAPRPSPWPLSQPFSHPPVYVSCFICSTCKYLLSPMCQELCWLLKT